MAVATSSSSLPSLFLSSSRSSSSPFPHSVHPPCRLYFHRRQHHRFPRPALNASQRPTNSYQNRRWGQVDFGNEYEDDEFDDEDGEGEDRSLDLLVSFVENVFRKLSKRARRAVRSVLPVTISTKLVGFAVNGSLILAFLWVLKAFIEVICTLGSVIFVSILLIRGVWSGVAYLQESRNFHLNQDDDGSAWTGARPAT